MVKTPRTRHSKSTREPVTIDLAPGEVSRVKAEAEAADRQPPKEKTAPAPDAPKEASAGKPKEAPAQKPGPAESKADAPKQSASPSSGPAFGRKEPTSAPPPPREPGRKGSTGMLAAGAAGGVIALLLAGGLQVAGLLPGGRDAPQDHAPAVAALEREVATLRQDISSLEAGGGDDPALAGRVAEAEERVTALASALEALQAEVSQLDAQDGGEAAAPDLSPLEDRIAAVEAAVAALDDAAPPQPDPDAVDESIAALQEEIATVKEGQAAAAARLDALEQSAARLGERLDEQAEAPATAFIIAASALRAAIDRGAPFTTELETFASLAPDAPQVEGLRAHAASGVATHAQLAAEANAAANAMISAATPVDPQAGIVDRLWASATGMVQVRPVGMVEGDGAPEIVARLDAAVEAGDYERAIAEFETLPEAAKAAGEPFMTRLRARHDADRLADEALAAALRA